jgi:hypothetical protein
MQDDIAARGVTLRLRTAAESFLWCMLQDPQFSNRADPTIRVARIRILVVSRRAAHVVEPWLCVQSRHASPQVNAL